MEVLDYMISDAIKKKAGYKYYMAKKVESEKAKIVDEPEEQHVSPIKSRRGKGFMCYGDQVAYVPNKLKKDVVPRKTRSLTKKESANETDDADESDMDYLMIIYMEMMMLQSIECSCITSLLQHPILPISVQRKENSLSYNNSPTKLPKSQSKEVDAKEAFEKPVQAKVLTEIKKLLPTHIPNTLANYVKPHLNTSVLELLNRIYSNKSNETHTTHHQLYDTLYASITLDQDVLDAQAAQSSFHKRSHAKKFKELIQKDELTIADLEGAGLKWLKVQYNIDVELEYHVCPLKAAVLSEAQWNSDEEDVSKPISFERHMQKVQNHILASTTMTTLTL
ncbi:hypothetical protein Tco_0033582 [Tanacetum coccineum]